MEEGKTFLRKLQEEVAQHGVPEPDPGWGLEEKLSDYLQRLEEAYRVPLPLQCAVERYREPLVVRSCAAGGAFVPHER